MVKVALRAGAPRQYTPGHLYGKPRDRYPGLRPEPRQYARRIADRDEFPTTITAVGLDGPPGSRQRRRGSVRASATPASLVRSAEEEPGCVPAASTGTPQTFPVACRHAMNNAHRKFPPRHYQRDAPHPAQIRQVSSRWRLWRT